LDFGALPFSFMRTMPLNAHENEPTCAQFGGPTECAGKSNGRVVFRVVNGLVDWKREAHASALMGMTGPFAWPR